MLSDDQRKLLTTAIAVVAGCALAWYLLVDRNPPKPQPQVTQLKGIDAKEKKQPTRVAQSTEEQQARPLPPPMPILKPRPTTTNLQPLDSPNPKPAPTTPPADVAIDEVDPTPQEPAVPVQIARLALGFVGADPQAEEVWYAAINDPNMPPKARQDLIEDLNEDGFADPRHVTEDDLPLIYSRIALIEQVAPDAMDDVNAAAFAEAYKDLVNMVVRLEQEAIAREEAQAAGQDLP
ncbi:MAG TPA: hypothetical protein VGP94_12580, partial [Tepidisphaeraceae bacterium]|nr:hypothetical protein [Tepidisphaeraceae bacterium]